MKKFFKYISVGVLALGLTLGLGKLYQLNQFKYEDNVTRYDRSLGKVVVFGDSGQPGSILNKTIEGVDKENPNAIFILGDEKYLEGIQTEQEFIDYILKPFFREGRLVFFVGGNHTQYAAKNRDFLLKLARSKKYPWFIYLNYYYGVVSKDVCFALQDTAIGDVKIKWPWADVKKVIKAQKAFIGDDFPNEPACKGLPLYLLQHHGIFASDSNDHGDRTKEYGNDWLIKFYIEKVLGVYKLWVNGHSHITSAELCHSLDTKIYPAPMYLEGIVEGVTCHYTVGGVSKSSECGKGRISKCFERPGVLVIEGNKVELKVF